MVFRRVYFEVRTGFMQWRVFFTDDEFATQATASDNVYWDRHQAMIAAMAMGYAFTAGASFALKNPAVEQAYWNDTTNA
jgi:hypothetical protein